MNKSIKKNFVELNKTLAKLHLNKRMPTASERKLVASKPNKLVSKTKRPTSRNNQNTNSTEKLKKLNRPKMANVSFEDDLDMAMTSAGYALYVAIKRQNFREIVRLLEAGAHCHIKSGLRGGGPLHHLITLCPGELLKRFRLKTAEIMLDYHVDANLIDFYGKTALMLACSDGYLELVKLLAPRTDPLIQDCRLNTALIYTVLGQKVGCCIELMKHLKLPLVSKVIRIRNCNGFNAIELAKQLGNREIVLHLTHCLAIAEQTFRQQLKGKLDPNWPIRAKYGWRADWLDWSGQYGPINPLYWAGSRSMESLSTKDDFDDDLRMVNREKILRDRKLAVDPIVAVKNREKALSSREEIEKVLAGHSGLSRLNSLNLRRKLEEERLNRAMSMYNLPSRRYYDEPILSRPWKDDDSVTSSMILDYDLQHNIKQTQKQRMFADALGRKTNDRYIDQLMLSDNMFYGDPYEDLWQKETYSWFKNAKKDSKLPNSSHEHHQHANNANNSTLPRRMSKIDHTSNREHKLEAEEQIKNADQQIASVSKPMTSHQSAIAQPNFKLPPIPNQRTESYEAWLLEQELKK